MLEVAVCFIPALLILLYGVLSIPILFVVAITSGKTAAIWSLGAVLTGIAGLIGLVQLLVWLFGAASTVPDHKVTLLLVCIGVMTVAGLSIYALRSPLYELPEQVILILPLLSTLHLGYIARDFLVKGASQSPLSYHPRAAY